MYVDALIFDFNVACTAIRQPSIDVSSHLGFPGQLSGMLSVPASFFETSTSVAMWRPLARWPCFACGADHKTAKEGRERFSWKIKHQPET